MHERDIDARIKEMLEIFELGKWQNELVESFSHGMKQRLVMSAAFLHRPKAVLVDEPMVGLDPRGARLIKDVFRRMAEHGVAILMSTHTLEVAQEMCDLISIILKGKIIAHGTVTELRVDGGIAERGADAGVPQADRRQRAAGDRGDRVIERHGDHAAVSVSCCCRRCGRRAIARAGARRATAPARSLFGGIGLGVMGALFYGAFWVTWQAAQYGGARRLPDSHRLVVAVPDVPVVPRVQRRRRVAVDVLSLR